MSLTCEWCGKVFERSGERGPIPKYCSANHRQRAYEARRAVKVFTAAMPKVDLSASAFQEVSAEALGLTEAMEAATAPMRDALSSVAFDQLEAIRLEASEMIRVFEDAMPRIDVGALAGVQELQIDDLAALVESDSLARGRHLIEELQASPFVEWSMHDVREAMEIWSLVDDEVDALRSEIDQLPEDDLPPTIMIVVAIATLLSVEAESSRILLDSVVFSAEALGALFQLLWQAASLPGISAPIGTIGGLAGIIGLALYIHDRGRAD